VEQQYITLIIRITTKIATTILMIVEMRVKINTNKGAAFKMCQNYIFNLNQKEEGKTSKLTSIESHQDLATINRRGNRTIQRIL
jgi:hypothetical protein